MAVSTACSSRGRSSGCNALQGLGQRHDFGLAAAAQLAHARIHRRTWVRREDAEDEEEQAELFSAATMPKEVDSGYQEERDADGEQTDLQTSMPTTKEERCSSKRSNQGLAEERDNGHADGSNGAEQKIRLVDGHCRGPPDGDADEHAA